MEPQWPGAQHAVGAIRVPVQANAPNVTSAMAGYSPGSASLPPTIATAGEADNATAATTVAIRCQQPAYEQVGTLPWSSREY